MSIKMAELIRKWMKLFHVMLTRDIRSIILLVTFQIKMFWYKQKNIVMLHFFDENVRKFPEKPAIFYKDEQYTFENVSDLANRISNWIESSLKLGHDDQWELLHKVSVISNDEQQQNQQNNNGKENIIQTKIYQQFNDNLQTTQIGLMLGNIPELASFLIGIARVRCSAIMFNTNHRRDTLINAFQATKCQIFIFERKYLQAIKDVAENLPDIKFFLYDRDLIKQPQRQQSIDKNLLQIDFNYDGMTRMDLINVSVDNDNENEKHLQFSKLLQTYPTTSVLKKYPYKFTDKMIYIFTSGTTGGNIKASPADNVRQIASYFSQCRAFDLNSNDNIYICLPCYHSFAGITGLGYMFIGGITITLADKFSATKFWKDCCQYQCTAAIYIGETCRYLLAQPYRQEETQHSLRIMMGPGMKREIWREFQTRFHIRRIGEYYGSTEGNVQTFNMTNVEGSCGFIPYYYGILCRLLFHVYLIKVDPETMELERCRRNGLCKFAKPGETGMLVGQIRPGHSFSEFLGYTSTKESTKKIIRNVRTKGDFAFVSGDLMEMDFYGNLYFKDRTGDTFRWKGENVSTTEIEDIISQFTKHQDCVVYGVTVPGYDGRAGMLATNDRQLNLDRFYQFMYERVPDYAIPKFIRITDDIQMTSTLKFIKYPLRKVGFDLKQTKPMDQLYYWNCQQSKYLPIDSETYDKILNGQIKIS
ncbi:long-chain fatty acid transport protein 4-like [Dermatophagoides pteronyssinus]|uniref:long-chain fatty acid transport protein 4-like n=1 Tax=Dermatophagoides pteronyssinus TaxID=6956 RepID=UPI003F676141